MSLKSSLALALFTTVACPAAALAHAHLRQAVPAAGSTVAASPDALRLHFSEGLNLRFSGVVLSGAAGPVQLDPPTLEAADPALLVAKLGQPLDPGTYTVRWHALSLDSHKTQGKYDFTIKP